MATQKKEKQARKSNPLQAQRTAANKAKRMRAINTKAITLPKTQATAFSIDYRTLYQQKKFKPAATRAPCDVVSLFKLETRAHLI